MSDTSRLMHPWSKDALLMKAQRYAQEMLSCGRDEWRFGLASAFVLEFVARAALAKVSPVLLARNREWEHLYYALGHSPIKARYKPRSVEFSEVLNRLEVVRPAFTTELKGFSLQHMEWRNEELHDGGTPFDGLQPTWLARFYETCKVLLNAMDEELPVLFGELEAEVAEQLIIASRDQSAMAVHREVAAHKNGWEEKSQEEKDELQRQALSWATRQDGHRVKCPACGSHALLNGAPISAVIRKLEGDFVVEAQDYLPSKFECIACRLKIAGLSHLTACGLGSPYKSTSAYDAAEYYSREDAYAGFDDDFNEP